MPGGLGQWLTHPPKTPRPVVTGIRWDRISANPLLQTPEVENCTRSILTLIQGSELEKVLRQKTLKRGWQLFVRAETLQKTFAELDSQKSTLTLIINNIQSHALHQMQTNIVTIAAQDNDLDANDARTQPPRDSKKRTGTMVNGFDIFITRQSQDSGPLRLPTMRGRWENCHFTGEDSSAAGPDDEAEGVFNGARVIVDDDGDARSGNKCQGIVE
ncbi:hypothetical protein PCL_07404 [Purpureocillium lilacinum]|uniref:Uncharacterized protein n=1 Tax=Purpureocillium lilacinum TaxID=33203 RepID=A0A2U3DS88_PURLI|nr:hypothetical protein PCL_07404 [Purpureocillium lilacinum]